jgi:hypothetical protein
MAPKFSEKRERERDQIGLDYLTQYDDQPRRFGIGWGWQCQTEGQLEGLRQAGKYLLAVERVRSKKAAYRLTKDQMEQVKEHEATEKTAFESGLRAMYPSVWLRMEKGQSVLEKSPVSCNRDGAKGVARPTLHLGQTVRYGRSLSAVESLKHLWGGHEELYESRGSRYGSVKARG